MVTYVLDVMKSRANNFHINTTWNLSKNLTMTHPLYTGNNKMPKMFWKNNSLSACELYT